jgi:hypothetical protein
MEVCICVVECMAQQRRTLEDSHGGGEVVDSPGGAQGRDDDGGRGNEIVGKAIVQVALPIYQLATYDSIRMALGRPRGSASVPSK